MTALNDLLVEQIHADGPITVASYMQTCLMHPEYGYYATRDPFGRGGDFVTAPEISQMFGELIGLALATAWQAQGAPNPFVLVELGPGRGTLMADLLRATKGVPGFHDALTLHLVETSPTLRAAQIERLGAQVTHHDSIDTVPDKPMFLVANEFFDALPIRQYVRKGAHWRERIIGLKDDELVFGLSDPVLPDVLTDRTAQDGDLVEDCPSGRAIAHDIGRRIARVGGTAVIIDYGNWRSLGDTLQAMKSHAYAPPLVDPGTADLTAHVDFEAIAKAAAPAQHTEMTGQGVFLERLGITHRAQALAKKLTGQPLTEHIAAHRRLTHPEEMGTLFKVMALYPTESPPPPGFDP